MAGFDPAESTQWLREALAIEDAKSLYDYLQKESAGGRDRRCSIQVQVARRAMNQLGCEIRRVDHPAMLVDGLTKRKARLDLMLSFMRTGMIGITEEAATMAGHEEIHESGRRLPRHHPDMRVTLVPTT